MTASSTKEKLSNNLSETIKQRRLTMSVTLAELAAGSGVSTSHLGRMERGERFPSARILQKIAKPLGFEEDDLFRRAGYLSPRSSTQGDSETHVEGLDPYVASVLASETVEVQRTVIGILTILKSIAQQPHQNNT